MNTSCKNIDNLSLFILTANTTVKKQHVHSVTSDFYCFNDSTTAPKLHHAHEVNPE